MSGTFSQMYVQVVFAVRGRASLIREDWEKELYKYISGIIKNKDQKPLAINGMPDHIHILIGIKPSCKVSDLIREIKKSSNIWVNEKGFCKKKFEWQEGYGCFTYSHSSLDQVIKYINNQKEHHNQRSFREEYKEFLSRFQIDHKDEYLFDWLD